MRIVGEEIWDCQHSLERELARLLSHLHRGGPMAADQLARHCLRIEELLPHLPGRDRLTSCCDDLHTLVDALNASADWPETRQATARAWHANLQRLRQSINWLRFSMRLRRRCEQRAAYLVDEALQRQWIERSIAEDMIVITNKGVAVLERRLSRTA